MTVTAMNHFTILTDKLPETLAFYEAHLNLKPGARPPFTFPGAWLYADGGRGKDPYPAHHRRRGRRAPGEGRDRSHGVLRARTSPAGGGES
jgi:catechol 2,3-dioxygenase-like lactoylglutathione lyase family enzyme